MKVLCHSAKGTTWKNHKYISKEKSKKSGKMVYKYPPGAIGEGAHDGTRGFDGLTEGQANSDYYEMTRTGYAVNNYEWDMADDDFRNSEFFDGYTILSAIDSKSKNQQRVLKLMDAFSNKNVKLSDITGITKLNKVEKIIDNIFNGGKKQKEIYDAQYNIASIFNADFLLNTGARGGKRFGKYSGYKNY